MKRIICCILVCLTAFTLASCNNSNISNEDFLKSLQNSEEDKKEDGKNKGSIGSLGNETQSETSDKSEDAEGADDKSMNSAGNYTDNAIANEVLAFMDYSEEKPFRGVTFGDPYNYVIAHETLFLDYDIPDDLSKGKVHPIRDVRYVFSDDVTIDIPGYVVYRFEPVTEDGSDPLDTLKAAYYPDGKYSTNDYVEAYRALREYFSTRYTKVNETGNNESDVYCAVFQMEDDRHHLVIKEDLDLNNYSGRRRFIIALYTGGADYYTAIIALS